MNADNTATAGENRTADLAEPAQSPSLSELKTVLHLEQRALAALNIKELGFVIVNETNMLSEFRQSLILNRNIAGQFTLFQASGLASIVEDSPFSIWLQSLVASLDTDWRNTGPLALQSDTVRDDLREGWLEWLPEQLVIFPIADTDDKVNALVLYAREARWTVLELDLLQRLHATYAYCFRAMETSRSGFLVTLRNFVKSGRLRWVSLALASALFIPIRLSVLAPAEVVALDAVAVASPLDGVVGAFHVEPNSPVDLGDPLFSLDDTSLRSQRNIAMKALMIARSDALVAEQKSFDDYKSKAELASALGRVREKEAELTAVEILLNRVTVRAEKKGLAIFSDKNDWIGRPVQTGERIMQVANAEDAGVRIWLPVADAINLEPGAPIRLFLHTQPLSPLSGNLLQTSYQASQSPAGVSAYKLFGGFEQDMEKPRLGLRGTARISSDWTVLGYYLFRRPIAALREFTGL